MERDFWLRIVQSQSFVLSYNAFLKTAPDSVWLDKEIVLLLAALGNCEVLKRLQQYPLSEDRDIVATALERRPDHCEHLSPRVQAMYPDLVATAIRNCSKARIWVFRESLAPSLWHDTRVVYAWLARGGDYLPKAFSPEMKRDEQAFLLIAEHTPDCFFVYATPELLTKEYLTRVLNISGNPHLFPFLPMRLAHDYDLALVALAGSFSSTRATTTSSSAKA
jgi:hypothetical protein